MSPDVAPLPLPSASTISATATSGVHVVKLSGYSLAKQFLDTGEFVESAVFRAAGQSWRIKVYPNGGDKKCAPRSIALFLALVGGNSKAADVRAMFQFSLVRHGRKLASAPDGGRLTEAPVTFKADERDCWGFEDEGFEGKLEGPEYLRDDAILIRCDIAVLNDPAAERKDLEALDILCDCNDGLCKNLHLHDSNSKKKKKSKKASADMLQEKTPPSASTIAVATSAGCHVVKVSGYAQTKLLTGNGKHINSAEFEEAGHRWRILYYPNGYREDTAGHIALYLELAGESTDVVHAKFQFSLVPHGQLRSAPHGGRTAGGRVTFRSKHKQQCYGFKHFMAPKELEKSAEYLKDDCFYVRCDVTAMNKPVAKLRDPEALELLCYCNDDLCENIHAPRKVEAEDEAYGKPRRCLGVKKMFLSCLPVRVKTSQHPVFDVEYTRL